MTEFGEIQTSTGKINYFAVARITKTIKNLITENSYVDLFFFLSIFSLILRNDFKYYQNNNF